MQLNRIQQVKSQQKEEKGEEKQKKTKIIDFGNPMTLKSSFVLRLKHDG
jgi:hypothetical protein